MIIKTYVLLVDDKIGATYRAKDLKAAVKAATADVAEEYSLTERQVIAALSGAKASATFTRAPSAML